MSDANARKSVRSPASSSKTRKKTRRVIVITCSLITVCVIVAVIAFQGRVTGTEFNPQSFDTRTFSFYEIPGLQIQLTPIRRTVTTPEVSRHLRNKGWIKVSRKTPATTWHTLNIARGSANTSELASLLHDSIELFDYDNGDFYWKEWSDAHRQQAAVLWPIVQKLASRELYVFVPELLAIARTSRPDDPPSVLANALDQWLINQYAIMVDDLRDAQRQNLADELLEEALTDYPSAELLLQRKESPAQTASEK